MAPVKDITFHDLHVQMQALDGYHGFKGRDDNFNKIWRDLQPTLQGQPYCAGGDCYIWKHAGHPYPQIDHVWGFSFCPDAVRWAKDHGLWDADGHYEPGDTSFFCWDGSGVAEHPGTVVKDEGSGGLHDFECNTSADASGDQSNGDGCYFKVRPHGAMLMGVLKSSVWLKGHPHHQPPPKPGRPIHNPHTFDRHDLNLHRGSVGETVKWAQWALSFHGTEVDGEFGPKTERATRLFQKVKGLHVDGIIGPQTASVLLHVTRR
jgi:hypothetical protein